MNLLTKDAEKSIIIAGDISNILKNLEEIEAIAIYGSVAREFADIYSDVDIVCFCTKIPTLRKVEQTLKGYELKHYFIPDSLIKFEYEGKSVNVLFKNKKRFDAIANQFVKHLHPIEKDAFEAASNTLSAKVIYDPYRIFATWKKRLEYAIVTRYKEMAIKVHYPQVIRALKENRIAISGKRNEFINVHFILNQLITDIVAIIYALNNRIHTNPKWAIKEIETFNIKPKNCGKILMIVSLLGNDADSLIRKQKLLKNLVNDLHSVIKKECPKVLKEIERYEGALDV